MFSPLKYVATATLFACSILCSAQSSPPPSWVYSSYFGGSKGDTINAATRDAAGNVYVAGITSSPDFPTTPGVYEPVYPGPTGYYAIFVSKFSAEGALVWSTFVGPGTYQFSVASGVQVDSAGKVYVAGIFQDPGFPTTPGLPNNGSVFVAKLNSTGSQLIYGATMGPSSTLSNPQLVLDSMANAFVTGTGNAGDCCDGQTGMIGTGGGVCDYWVAEINAAGNALIWSVQIGGLGLDSANGLAIDSANKLYAAGYSDSTNYPRTRGALNQYGIGRTFVTKLDPSQPPSSSMVYSALIGNPGNSSNDYIEAQSIAVDHSGHAYVGAWTYNLGLFTSPWAFQAKAPATPNAYVFELNRSGSSIVNGTYLGGGRNDYVGQVSVDRDGDTYIAGYTNSWDFRTTAYGTLQAQNSLLEGYYVKLNPQFAAVSSVEFGGTLEGAQGFASVPDGAGGLWVAGYAGSQFPTTANAYQPSYQGKYDGYVLHTDFAGLCGSGDEGVALCGIAADSTLPERLHFTGQASDVERVDSIVLDIDGMPAYGLHAAQFDTWLPVAPGSHVATVVTQDTTGERHQEQQSFSVTASSSCPLNPVSPSLTLCSPLNAAVVDGLLMVQAVANDGIPPTTVQLYVDGKLWTTITGQGGSYIYTLQLTPGIHRVGVRGTDGDGFDVSTTAVARVER